MSVSFQLDESVRVLTATPGLLEAWLPALPPSWLEQTEGEGSWSPTDLVAHLIHGEIEDWIPRLVQILEGRGHEPFRPFDPRALWDVVERKPLADLLLELRTRRERSLAWVAEAGLAEGDLDRTGLHPTFGVVTVRQLIATWAAHDLNHVGQMARVLARQYRGAVGPWRAFLPIMDR